VWNREKLTRRGKDASKKSRGKVHKSHSIQLPSANRRVYPMFTRLCPNITLLKKDYLNKRHDLSGRHGARNSRVEVHST